MVIPVVVSSSLCIILRQFEQLVLISVYRASALSSTKQYQFISSLPIANDAICICVSE